MNEKCKKCGKTITEAHEFAKGGICISCEFAHQAIIKIELVFIIIFSLIAIGTMVFHLIEDIGWFDSFYFTVATVTTVGYGDFVPVTHAGKIFAAFYMLINIPILLFAFSVIAEFYFERGFSGLAKSIYRRVSKEE